MQPETYSTFNPAERVFQSKFAMVRDRLSRPLLRLFAMIGVTPDLLSFASLLVLVLLPLGFFAAPDWILIGYALNLFFDGIDGALARHLKLSTKSGAYLDIIVDHASFVFSVLVLLWFTTVNPFWASAYVIFYLVIIVHMVALNAMGSPPSFPVLRSKYFLYACVILSVYKVIEIGLLDDFFKVFAIYYFAMDIVYVLIFRWELQKHGESNRNG